MDWGFGCEVVKGGGVYWCVCWDGNELFWVGWDVWWISIWVFKMFGYIYGKIWDCDEEVVSIIWLFDFDYFLGWCNRNYG